MTDEKKVAFCRLAIRSEGEFVNAYMAEMGTMDSAVLLSSIRRTIIDNDRRAFDLWRDFLQAAFGDMLKGIAGAELEWGDPQPAPEHERSGRA